MVDRATRERIDEMTFNMYVDLMGDGVPKRHLAAEVARQWGCNPATVRARVKRHSRRISAERRAEQEQHR